MVGLDAKHDALWLVKEVEKHGVRAWMWHDFLRKDNMDPAHFIGFQMAPWMQTGEAYRRLLFRGSKLLAEAKAVVRE